MHGAGISASEQQRCFGKFGRAVTALPSRQGVSESASQRVGESTGQRGSRAMGQRAAGQSRVPGQQQWEQRASWQLR